ncbi:MAG: radical SAM protein [Phycisphaerales bacterium]|nr:MAG: radical SAM protein [Phycisphaerales bacterium]
MERYEITVEGGWLALELNGRSYFYDIENKRFVVLDNSLRKALLEFRDLLEHGVFERVDDVVVPSFGGPAKLSSLTITAKCNMKCPYCFVYPVRQTCEMTPSVARNAVQSLRRQVEGHLTIYLWGGEPTLNPHALFAACSEGQKYEKTTLVLTTNGVFSDDILKELLNFENLHYQLSYDGRNAQNSQKLLISGGKSLRSVEEKVYSIVHRGRGLNLRTTVTRDNLNELYDIFSSVVKLNATLMVEHVHTSVGRSIRQKSKEPEVNDYSNAILRLLSRAERSGILLVSAPFSELRLGRPHRWAFANVLPDGQVVATNAIVDSTHPKFRFLRLGELSDNAICIDTDNVRRMAQNLVRNAERHCAGCFAKPLCRGGAQRDAFSMSDNLQDLDMMRCRYYRTLLGLWLSALITALKNDMEVRGFTEGVIRLDNCVGCKVRQPLLVHDKGLRFVWEGSQGEYRTFDQYLSSLSSLGPPPLNL